MHRHLEASYSMGMIDLKLFYSKVNVNKTPIEIIVLNVYPQLKVK